MSRAQTTRLFITDTSNTFDSLVLPETHKRYGHLIAPVLRRQLKSQQEWEILGRTLITICQYAKAARQIDVLREVSEFLVSLPLRRELQTIGLYYQAEVAFRTGEPNAARVAFENLATHPQFPWKSRAIASLATCHATSGDLDTATRFCAEAVRSIGDRNRDVLTWLASHWLIAIIRSRQGDHKNALDLLNSLNPLVADVGKIYGAIYYDYLNSLAVRLIGLNRLDEAEQLNRITLASPLPKEFFPFQETRDEIREKREAAATTVYVNIDPVPRLEPALREQIPDQCRPAIDPEAEAWVKSQPEVETILLQSELDIATGIALRDTAESRWSQPEPKPSVKLNSDSQLRTVIILCNPQRRTAALLPSKSISRLQRPLIPMSVAIPDNHRPRAPPIT